MAQAWAFSQCIINAKAATTDSISHISWGHQAGFCSWHLLPKAERVGWWLLAVSPQGLARPVGTCEGKKPHCLCRCCRHSQASCPGCPLAPAAAWRSAGLAPVQTVRWEVTRSPCCSCSIAGGAAGGLSGGGQRTRGDLREGHGFLVWMGSSRHRAPR